MDRHLIAEHSYDYCQICLLIGAIPMIRQHILDMHHDEHEIQTSSSEEAHSELKFQKKSIFKSTKSTFLTFSKVQKHIFCYFKNGKKSIFASKKV